ncbi:ras and EF-hand domain-containing protein homolog isoform X2 [Acropora millepora]|uniref:ras and EF-hand domain-containing protein homolog isoform X2 n=1 Tax=Acropora millepora TaxID=45264 RepID=UPI001CF1FB90|nr:ras and EF-hand domain-containing protein homolog isoform X2 [Acropora millepora]
MASLETVRPGDLFGTVDLDGSGYIDREELAAVCDLDAKDLAEVFDKLDADKDGRISIEEFSENFRKFRSVVSGVKRKKSEQPSDADVDYEDLKEKLGRSYSLLSGQEYVSELFHYLHNSGDSPQLLALLESFLFSVIRDVKHYSSENERLEEALKRTCEKHTEHMDQLDNEMEQQMQRLESRIRKEEKSKQERANVDIVWQLENKNKEIQTLNARVQKLEGRLKRKEPEEQKIKEEVDEKVQEIRFLRSQLTDAQTNLAVLRSELAQLRNDYEEQETQLTAEKATVMECVQEQESLTRQLQLLHEANKKLHDTNDDLRSALERTRLPDRRSPSPNKRHSISTLYSPTSSFTRNTKSSGNRSSPAFADDSVDGGRSGHTSPSRRLPSSTPLPLSSTNSRRGSLLPSQQSCEVDDESLVNENSLMTELTQAQQLSSLQKDLIDYEDDDTYSSMKPSQRQTFSKQLEILHKTNERLCSSNDDLRAALEALTGRRPFSLKSKSRRNSEKCQRNPSVHSDYGSISSRSITPNHFQGPKSEYDVGDGAEADELSGYDPESDATTMTIKARHFEAAPNLSKLTATANERHVTVQKHANDVMWEGDTELGPETVQSTVEQSNIEMNSNGQLHRLQSPFDRNSHLRKPCRHKSLEHLLNKSNGKGDRSAWPSIARAGKWNSMEQMRKRGAFIGQRTGSLPAPRPISEEGPNYGKEVGICQLSEKLDALRSSREKVPEIKDLSTANVLSRPHSPVMTVIQNLNTELDTASNGHLNQLVRKPAHTQIHRKLNTKEERIKERLLDDEKDRLMPVNQAVTPFLRRTNSLVVKRNHLKTDSPPESDNGKPDAQLSAELEAQFKSVIEEDDEDIDEDDVGDEELAKLVAMASALTESEGETDTETEAPEGERVPAVGSDSISEASSNAPVKVTASEGADPERMYKLVLAGDAAVGKSSFILRLCRNKFHNALNSTLGVDFQTKTLCVDGKTIAFQLWDTAGQERFRSIAKSYFRKADGVLLLYDVTCETSFLDVRDWVEAIEESTPTPIPIMMCGNKIDLRQSFLDEGKTVITQESGEKLAKEYGALFLEISSKENTNITEACVELGRLLRNIEDTEVKESSGLKLTEGDSKNKKKPNCCPV